MCEVCREFITKIVSLTGEVNCLLTKSFKDYSGVKLYCYLICFDFLFHFLFLY